MGFNLHGRALKLVQACFSRRVEEEVPAYLINSVCALFRAGEYFRDVSNEKIKTIEKSVITLTHENSVTRVSQWTPFNR